MFFCVFYLFFLHGKDEKMSFKLMKQLTPNNSVLCLRRGLRRRCLRKILRRSRNVFLLN